jgi:hypothetical protein
MHSGVGLKLVTERAYVEHTIYECIRHWNWRLSGTKRGRRGGFAQFLFYGDEKKKKKKKKRKQKWW